MESFNPSNYDLPTLAPNVPESYYDYCESADEINEETRRTMVEAGYNPDDEEDVWRYYINNEEVELPW